MPAEWASPEDYLASLPDDRQEPMTALRDAINEALPEGYQEGIQYGMIGWSIPHSIYPAGYHCDPKQPVPFISIASQKSHIAVYLYCLYLEPDAVEKFQADWKATGTKLDMGKSCLRFKKWSDVRVELIQDVIRSAPVEKFLAAYEASIPASARMTK
jgi:uncharacterized protein YdhG (YjbR/CyaY superfamily)